MQQTSTPATPPRGKTQYVFEWLRERILSGELQPGTMLRQSEIADTLGVSYTPVREAMRQLQATGLLQYQRDRGCAVTELGEQAIAELYQLRGAIEGLAARLAASTRTPQQLAELTAAATAAEEDLDRGASAGELARHSRRFHARVAEIGGPEIIAPRLEQLWTSFPIPHSASLWADREHAGTMLAEHRDLIELLAAGDAEAAAALMTGHIEQAAAWRTSQATTLDAPS